MFNTLTGENVLTIDGTTNAGRAITVDGEPLLDAPWGLALQRDAFEMCPDDSHTLLPPVSQLRDLLFVSDRRRAHIAVFEARSGRPLRRIDLQTTPSSLANTRTLSTATSNQTFGCGLALLPPRPGGLDGDALLFVAEYSSGSIAVFNARTGRRLRTITVQPAIVDDTPTISAESKDKSSMNTDNSAGVLLSPAGLALRYDTHSESAFDFPDSEDGFGVAPATTTTQEEVQRSVESTRTRHVQLIVGDFQSNRVLVLEAATGRLLQQVFASGVDVIVASGPAALAVAPLDDASSSKKSGGAMLFVSEWASHRIRKIRLL